MSKRGEGSVVEKESLAKTGQSASAAAVRSCRHLSAVVKTAEDGTESGAKDGLVRARCLVCGTLGPPREGSDEAFRALAKFSLGDASQGTARAVSGISEGEPSSNSPGAKGNMGAIMDETLSEDIIGRHGKGKSMRGTLPRRTGGSE